MQANTIRVLTTIFGLTMLASAQVKTEVPPVEPGAKPVTVERITIHGAHSKAIWKAMPSSATFWSSSPRATAPTRIAAIL